MYLYPKGEEPKYRTYLTLFPAIARHSGSELDIPPNTIAADRGLSRCLKAPRALENFQPHMHLRGKAMVLEAILARRHQADAQLRGPFQLQLDDQLHLRRRRRAGAAQRHDHSRGRRGTTTPRPTRTIPIRISGSAGAIAPWMKWRTRGSMSPISPTRIIRSGVAKHKPARSRAAAKDR